MLFIKLSAFPHLHPKVSKLINFVFVDVDRSTAFGMVQTENNLTNRRKREKKHLYILSVCAQSSIKSNEKRLMKVIGK